MALREVLIDTHLPDDVKSYYHAVKARIIRRLQSGPATFLDLVRGSLGAYPTVVDTCLQEISSQLQPVILHGVQLMAELPEALCQESLLSNVEGNPALSSWYFSSDACDRLEKLREWSDARLAFLGTPRLYEWFARRRIGKTRVILDLDSTVLSALKELTRQSGDLSHLYDIREALPAFLRESFDCVFFDPPWYPEYYILWLSRAAELAPGGTVVFSLFPELTRPNASEQRSQIVQALETISCHHLLLTSFTEYVIPSFELAELKHSGSIVDRPWKLADIVVSNLNPIPDLQQLEVTGLPKSLWEEVDFGPARVFVDTTKHLNDPRLLFLPNGNSAVLPSPSRRIPQSRDANVLSSRGHGLMTSRPKELLSILKLLSAAFQHGEDAESILSTMPLDSEEKRLLFTLLEGIGHA